MDKEKAAFYAGIRTALSVLALHDAETIFREIVETCDVNELITYTQADDEMEFSGLTRYGYQATKREKRS